MTRTTSSSFAVFFLLASIASVASAAPSASDMETARALFKAGMEARAAGKPKEALEKLKAAHALGRTPITGNELAHQYESAGMIVEALETALDVGRIPVAIDETERSAEARKSASEIAAQLKPRIPMLLVKIVTVSKTSADLVVTIDGKQLPDAAVGEPYRVDPGAHDVRAHYEGGDEVAGQVTLAERDSKTIELSPPAPKAMVKPGAQGKGGTTAVPAIIGFGLGGAGIIAGTITGILAINAKNDLENHCVGNACPSTYWTKIDDANLFGTLSTAAFIVAGAGTVFGLTWLLLTSDSNSAPPVKRGFDVRPGFMGVHGTFF